MRDARALGVTPSRLRAKDLSAPFHGVRAAALDLDDPLARVRAFVPRLADGHAFSHTTAALIYELRLPLRLERDPLIHVSAMLPARAPRARGISGHALAPGHPMLCRWRGFPVIDPISTLIHLAPLLTVDELVVAGDALVRRVQPLASVGEVLDRVSRVSGIRGLVKVRQAVPLIRARTDSAQETRLRLALVRAGLPEPIVGYRLHRADGAFIGTPDLAYPRQRVVLEYDGDLHRTSKQQFRADISRYEAMQDEGWRVIRVIPEDLARGLPRLIARVRTLLT